MIFLKQYTNDLKIYLKKNKKTFKYQLPHYKFNQLKSCFIHKNNNRIVTKRKYI